MISDDERRAVAQKLRNAVECHKYDLNDDPDYSPFTASNVLLSMFDRFPRYSDLLHLANLIDRPTCKYVPIGDGRFGCSWCGHVVKLDYDVPVAEETHMPFNYCPNCSAEVVEDV